MAGKIVLFDHDVRAALERGASTVARAVAGTLGPRGRNVALDRGFGAPVITNDGVSIAREIELTDRFENMGAEILKEVASKTNDKAGDGTTTAMVLAHAIIREGLKRTAMGANATVVRRGIEKAAEDAVAELRKLAHDVKSKDDVRNVARISAESRELGDVIADTIEKVGKDGVVTVESSQSVGIESEVVEGLEFNTGYVSPYMITNPERLEAELNDVAVLVTDAKVTAMQDILPTLEKLAQSGKKELVIIADDISGEALTAFVVNKLRGAFTVLGIKAPGYGDRKKEMLADIAAVVGAEVVSSDAGYTLDNMEISMLGSARRVVSRKDNTVIVGGKGKKKDVAARVEQLRAQKETLTSKFDIEKIEERIAKLTGGVAVIRVGAATETEMKYLKDKIEDAVNATKAAIEEGIVPGGGSALAAVSAILAKRKEAQLQDEFGIGYRILVDALVAPLAQIATNAGRTDAAVVVRDVVAKGNGFGFDATRDSDEIVLVNMFEEGIIDPVKVTRSGVQNAASAAAVLLTTDAAVADDPNAKEDESRAGGGM